MSQTKIVVLDGATLNPGDNPWTELETLGDLQVFDRSSPGELIERSEMATVVVVNKAKLTDSYFEKVSGLKLVAVTATGWDCVDGKAARNRGILVANVPVYGTDSVAQMTFALLLEVCHRIGLHDTEVHSGEWSRSPNFSFWKTQQLELAGRTLGLIGFGKIGRRVGQLASAFGMNVLACRHSRNEPPEYSPFQWGSLDEVLAKADVVSLHCPLTEETRGMINRDRLSTMKPGSILINTSRGGLIVEADLTEALNKGHLFGAAVDVVSQEPIRPDNPLLQAKNCIITPHIAWATLAARKRLLSITVKNIGSFLRGVPQNIVN